MEKKIERWHGAHHYGEKTHLMLVVFLFFAVFTLIWSYSTLAGVHFNNQKGPESLKPTPSQGATVTPTCRPRPACLDATPRCLIAESADMCPPSVSPNPSGVACTMEAKLCPDGVNYTYRTGPNCDFAACPGQHCGGFIANAPTCTSGYHCELNKQLPDAGGNCVKN